MFGRKNKRRIKYYLLKSPYDTLPIDLIDKRNISPDDDDYENQVHKVRDADEQLPHTTFQK